MNAVKEVTDARRRREDGAAWRHGRGLCGDFFPWYNTEHHHVGLWAVHAA